MFSKFIILCVGERDVYCKYSIVRLIGIYISADLGGSSNDSNVIFEDGSGERFHGKRLVPWVSRS